MKSIDSVKSYISDPMFLALRDRIVHGTYPPGTVLSERELTEEFKVSRTPYREAIRKLEDMKLVKVVPRFGTYVREIAISEIMNAYEVRLRVETMAAELAAKRRTEEDLAEFEAIIREIREWKVEDNPRLGGSLDESLHDLVCKSARNTILAETVDNLRRVCARIWTSSWIESYDFKKLVSHWGDIYEALKNRDSGRASAVMEAHLQDSIELMKENLFKFAAAESSVAGAANDVSVGR